MSKAAGENALNDLHTAAATVLTAQVGHQEEEVTFNIDGEEVKTGQMAYTASPATIAAAVKFLKDNKITCDVENDEQMGQLASSLKKRQKHSRLGSAKLAAVQ